MNTLSRPAVSVLKRLWAVVPSGGVLPTNVWQRRLRFLVGLTWFHAAIIAVAGPVLGDRWDLSFEHGTVPHTLAEALVVAAFAALASWGRSGRLVQATAVGFGLMSSSALLVHLSGGYIELHFHFFVMLVFLALLQDWIPYLLAVAFVAVHHGVVGVLWPQEVYNHPAAVAAPWTFAAIHALFVLGACVGSVIAWRFTERAFAQTALILDATGEGIFGLDGHGEVTFVNPAAATMLRASAARLVGRPLARVLRELGADGVAVEAEASPIVAPLRDRAPRYVTEASFERADGTRFPVDYISTPMTERGELTGVVVSFRDVTERKRVQADLQRSHSRLEEVLAELETTQRQVLQQERLRAMGEMASGIAHDFNNSLSPILGFSELLLRPERTYDRGKVETYVRLINTAARDASAVVRRLRELYTDREEPPATEPGDAAAGDDATLDRSRRLRILVVEDEPTVRRVITEQLSADGHTVDSATNGAEGLEKVLAGWFDLVITDRAMPEMGGDQLAAAIHEIAPTKPVIMLTGFGELMAAKGDRPAGVTLVVSKPVTQEQLRHAVAQATGASLIEQ
ncbi:MAG: response regulator [Candidatus Rokubacteria bacterium]|nr:response regulator [Candidatus Rokubacteria bacterium]